MNFIFFTVLGFYLTYLCYYLDWRVIFFALVMFELQILLLHRKSQLGDIRFQGNEPLEGMNYTLKRIQSNTEKLKTSKDF